MNTTYPEQRTIEAFSAYETERAIVSILLYFPKYADDICGQLTEDMFRDDDLRKVFAACRSLNDRGTKIDIASVIHEIGRLYEGADLTMLLIELSSAAIPSGSNYDYHCKILAQTYFKRRLFFSLTEIAPRLKAVDTDIFDAMDQVNACMAGMEDIIHRNTPARDLPQILDENEAILYRRMECREKGTMPGINTGLNSLNAVTMGWQKSDLIILAARPAMGKTAVALHFAKTAAFFGNNVLFFSLEMSDVQLSERLILSEAALSPEDVKSGNLTPEQAKEYLRARNSLNCLPLSIAEKGGVDINELCRMAKGYKRRKKCDLVIVDYLQLVTVGKAERVGNREQEVSFISRRLKALAKDLDVPVIALAQLSRGVETRTDKRPMMSDLRDSGGIEQDADIVMMLYRDEYYNKGNEATIGAGEIIIVKNRNGELRTCPFSYNPSMTKISNPSSLPLISGGTNRAYGMEDRYTDYPDEWKI